MGRGHRPTAMKVFRHGVLPGSTYGAQVWGLDAASLQHLRTDWLRTANAPGGGKSRSKSLALHGDPAGIAATAPLATYIDLVWGSVHGRRGMPALGTIRAWLATTTAEPRTWGAVRGPIGAMRKCLARVGWNMGRTDTAESGLLLTDARGHTHNILEVGPRGLKALLARDWKDQLAHQAARKIAGMSPTDRLDFHHLKATLQGKSSDLTEQEKAVARNFVTGGIWTRQRTEKAGYELPEGTACPKCGQAVDTIEHRLFECREAEVAATRDAHLPFWAAKWLSGQWSVIRHRPEGEHKRREETARQLAKQGLARDPSVGQPGPADEGEEGEGDTASGFSEGFAYSDGGCQKLFHPALDRASWAAVATNDAGEVLGAAWGPVWSGLPQTSPAGELVGLAAAVQLTPATRQHIEIGIDNMMAVNYANGPPAPRMLHRAFHAGLVRSMQLQGGWPAIQGHACHVKSHRLDKEPGLLSTLVGKERRDVMGNDAADKRATKGLASHPAFDAVLLRIDKRAHTVARKVVELAARLLPLFPELGRHERVADREDEAQPGEGEPAAAGQGGSADAAATAPPHSTALHGSRSQEGVPFSRTPARQAGAHPQEGHSAEAAPLPVAEGSHCWKPCPAAGHRCQRCGVRTKDRQPQQLGCEGPHRLLRGTGSGHSLILFKPIRDGAHPHFLACVRCGTTASTVGPLMNACPKLPTESRANGLRRLGKGMHPHSRGGQDILYQPGKPVAEGLAVQAR